MGKPLWELPEFGKTLMEITRISCSQLLRYRRASNLQRIGRHARPENDQSRFVAKDHSSYPAIRIAGECVHTPPLD
jgi:hypothetical protein